jgi:hypothetical protein
MEQHVRSMKIYVGSPETAILQKIEKISATQVYSMLSDSVDNRIKLSIRCGKHLRKLFPLSKAIITSNRSALLKTNHCNYIAASLQSMHFDDLHNSCDELTDI